jgi:UDP-N-acetylmuramate--alanine ligase
MRAKQMKQIEGPLHLIGVGGVGMSGLARILLARGVGVSGSDVKPSRELDALRALGAVTFVGHATDHITQNILGQINVVVISSAIRSSNVELVAARELGIPIITRAELLAQLMSGYRGIAVAGTHGKTTTTSILTVVMQHLGLDPSFAIGGSLNDSGANAHQGSGEFFIAEADESDGSFLQYEPELAIVTNIELDHVDHYQTVESFEDAFEAFAGTVHDSVIACSDDAGVVRLISRFAVDDKRAPKFLTYGQGQDAELQVTTLESVDGGMSADLHWRGESIGTLRTSIPGIHNVLNATGVILVGLHLGFSFADLAAGVEAYTGTRRRFELRGISGGVRVVDDYAHHPTEIRANMEAARQIAGQGRVIVIFQPHRFSRTEAFAKQFSDALSLADDVTVLEVYSAGEDPIPGVTGRLIVDGIDASGGRARFEPSFADAAGNVAARCKPGDLLLTLGAGDITMLAPAILEALKDVV